MLVTGAKIWQRLPHTEEGASQMAVVPGRSHGELNLDLEIYPEQREQGMEGR